MPRYIDRDELRKWVEGEIKSPSCPVVERAFGRRILMKIATTPTTEVAGGREVIGQAMEIALSAMNTHRTGYCQQHTIGHRTVTIVVLT